MVRSLIEAKSLYKNYGKHSQYPIIKDIDLSINVGDFIVITGKSGSGKSTLLHLLSGLETPSSGTVLYDGIDISKMTDSRKAAFRNKEMGFIFQSYNLQPFLTVHDNIIIPALFYGKCKKETEKRIKRLLEILDLSEKSNHYPSELSGGQCQRVAIARALINNPRIIFADEPTGNLDSINTAHIIKLLRIINQTFGTTIILVTHENEIAKVATRHIAISDGEIVQ